MSVTRRRRTCSGSDGVDQDELELGECRWAGADYPQFSRLVGDVLREVPADREPQPKYKFYI